MSMLQPQFDPFRQAGIYEEVGVDPYASADEVNLRLQAMAADLEQLSDADKAAKIGNFQDAVKKLKSPRNRVLLNCLLIDKLNTDHVVNLLARLPENLRIDTLKLPPLDVSSIVIEGENEEIAQVDFKDVAEDASLNLDLQAVNELLRRQHEPRHVTFES